MNIKRLNKAINHFTTAVKSLMETQPEEKVIAHFAKSPSGELSQILEICEQLEEYEICHVVSSALKSKEQVAA